MIPEERRRKEDMIRLFISLLKNLGIDKDVYQILQKN